jgi:predicted  nucleic acid-binding Zn-ribbon protein
MERRRGERRASGRLGERGMRCDDCGRVWFSAVADLVVARFACAACGGRLHRERRHEERRRCGRERPAAHAWAG